MYRIVFFLSVLWAGTMADAGAWGRDKGEWFIAVGGNFVLSDGSELPVHYDPTIYVEYGLTDRVTIGIDSHLADAGRIISNFVFVTVPIGDLNASDRFSAGIGLGLRHSDYVPPDRRLANIDYLQSEQLLRGSVSWGRGLKDGWLAVDASATYAATQGKWRPKADATWGRNWNEHWTTAVQLQTGQGFTDDYYAKLSPSVIYHFNDAISVSLGAVQGLTGDKGAGLKLEAWMRF